jgi:hydrogenase maturation protease
MLVLGYGNPGRGDDGLGPRIAEAVDGLGLPGVCADADYQLQVEDSVALAEADVAVFVDASREGADGFRVLSLEPRRRTRFSSHMLDPEALLAITRQSFGSSPRAWLVAVRGHGFDLSETFTERARENYRAALTYVSVVARLYAQQLEEAGMADNARKTVLVIDDDADIRSALRMVLEAGGFAVGEAGTAKEGKKAAERVKPDAIIIDLMMESVDAGTKLAQELKTAGFAGRMYLLSSAGDTVRYNIDAGELGLSGVFQKPLDYDTLVRTLKATLEIA